MYKVRQEKRVVQGDILEAVEYNIRDITTDSIETTTITLPFAVILSQDCDLEQDFNLRNNKEAKDHEQLIPSILLCPAFIAEKVKDGTHLEELGLRMQSRGTDLWKLIRANREARFHYMDGMQKAGIPNLVVDFKRYYTLPREEVYKIYEKSYKISIDDLYREALAQRFAYYLSRVALPETSES